MRFETRCATAAFLMLGALAIPLPVRGEGPPEVAAEWIYGTLERGGMAKWGDSGTPTTAAFHLERPYQLGQELDAVNPAPHGPESSHVDLDLTVLLARGYQANGDLAARHRVRRESAELFARAGDTRAQTKVLRDIPTGILSAGDELASIPKGAQEALERASAAGRLAEGKFLYETVISGDNVKSQNRRLVLVVLQ